MSKGLKRGNIISRNDLGNSMNDRIDREWEREELEKSAQVYEKEPRFKKKVKIFDSALVNPVSFIGAVVISLGRNKEEAKKIKEWMNKNSKLTSREVIDYLIEQYDIYSEDFTHQESLIWCYSQIKNPLKK